MPLDDLGRRQAHALANRLKATAIDRIVSSDLSRAVDTIAPLADANSEMTQRLAELVQQIGRE